MLDPQTRQQLQTKFQQVKPQLKQRFSGVTDQDLDAWRNDPDQLIATISQHVSIDEDNVQIDVEHDGRSQRLVADIPLKAVKRRRTRRTTR